MAETERESRKAWGDLPENHRALMRASIGAALSEVLDENERLRKAAAAALERTQVGDADEATALLEQVVTLAGKYLSPGGGADPTQVGVRGDDPSETASELGGAERPEEET
jgi:hypothetical protein